MSKFCLVSSTALVLTSLMLVLIGGCRWEPSIHPVSGKVTLAGKAYERLIVYFRPLDQKDYNKFTIGVGETDSEGNFTLGTNVGQGIAAGVYRVSFSCYQVPAGSNFDQSFDKPDEVSGPQPIDIVPAPYDANENMESSPLEFEVKAGNNWFEFDIPPR